MTIPKPFRVLSMEEFERLTTAEKAEYLREAVEAQKRVVQQFERFVLQQDKKNREQH
ncbi:MAG TPA: hypothetical protein VEB41_05250 [Burkholderiales bacterium]|nr:hypothetical protein [Burkholderiales bacterium]